MDGNLLGTTIDDAITVVVDLTQPGSLDLKFDGVKNFMASLSDPSKINIGQIISGVRSLLTVVESGMKADLLEKLPLIGSGLNLSASFIGKLRTMVDQLETLTNSASGSLDALKGGVQQKIFDVLGPNGAAILALNPLFHDDSNVPNNQEVADFRDVEVTLPSLQTPVADMEFAIKLNLAGRDKLNVDFDLGVDALAFGLNTQGGVEINWGYNFSLGFGVNLQKDST